MADNLYFDVTTLHNNPMHDGIRRATKMWLSELSKFNPIDSNFSIHPIYFSPDRIRYSYQYFIEENSQRNFLVHGQDLHIEKNSVIFFPAYDVFVPEFKIDFNLISKNAKIVSVIYDLLPITNPDWFPNPGTTARFEAAVQKQLLYSDKIIVNSNKVKKNLCQYISQSKIEFNSRNINVLALPGLGSNDQNSSAVRKKSRSAISNFLMVGTIEPRKGHDEVLIEFRRALSDGLPVSLTIVGRLGWSSQKLLAKLKQIERDFPKNFRWLRNASNEMVLEEYLRADAVIIASLDEGFGLPVVEALSQKKATVVRDIEVLNEVSQNCAITFGPNADYSSLYEIFLNSRSVLRKGEKLAFKFVPISPYQSTDLLLNHLKID